MVFSPWVKATRATANIGVSALAVGLWRLQSPSGHAVDTDQESRSNPQASVHIRFCGDGCYWFRFYSESLWKSPKVTKGLLPLSFGASL